MATTHDMDIGTAAAAVPEPAPAVGAAAGDPAILGLPVFAAGSVALGLALTGYVSPAGVGSALPIIFLGTGLGLLIATLWSAALGQTMVACIFGLFAGFWLSYSALVLGLNHGWFAIPTPDVKHSVAMFDITWAIVMGSLLLATLRLPVAYTAVVALVVVALVLLIFGTINADQTMTKAAGWVTFGFAALGFYLFLGTASLATGGKAYPLGPPILK
jgi:succinate-acetate transporter protein